VGRPSHTFIAKHSHSSITRKAYRNFSVLLILHDTENNILSKMRINCKYIAFICTARSNRKSHVCPSHLQFDNLTPPTLNSTTHGNKDSPKPTKTMNIVTSRCSKSSRGMLRAAALGARQQGIQLRLPCTYSIKTRSLYYACKHAMQTHTEEFSETYCVCVR
jgi:hypothetical protein